MRTTTMKSTVALLALGLLLACVQSDDTGGIDPSSADLPTDPPADPTDPPAVTPSDPTPEPTPDPPADPLAAPSADPTVPPSDPPADPTTDPPAAPSADPTVPPSDPPADPTTDPPADPTTDPPADPLAAPPADLPAAPPADPLAAPSADPTVPPSDPPADPTTDPPADPTTDPPADPLAAPPAPSADLPTEPPSNPPAVPADPPADPTVTPRANPPADPTNPPADPADRPTDPTDTPVPAASMLYPGKEATDRPSAITKVFPGSSQSPRLAKAEEPVSATPGSGRTSGQPAGPDVVGPAGASLAPVGTPSKSPKLQTPELQTKDQTSDKVTTAPGNFVVTKRMNAEVKTFSKTFLFPSSEKHELEVEKDLAELCVRFTGGMDRGSCSLRWSQLDQDIKLDSMGISGTVKDSVANQYLADIRKEKSPSKPGDKTTLIAILASCGALLAMIIGLGVYATHHRKPYNENQQHLTEELHTVENGYHDNPTLEVMEAQPEMQEKKTPLCCSEFNDSWIVPMETMAKEGPAEEDTHL